MFEDASAVDISLSRPTSRHLKDPGSPDVAQIQGFNFQAKTSQILTESAKKSRPFVDDSARAPRVSVSEVPVFANMRRSKSRETLDKHAASSSPSIDPVPAPAALLPEPDKTKSSPTTSNAFRMTPPLFAAAAAVATAAVAPPALTPVELAAQFLAAC